MNHIGEKIKELRRKKDLTQEKLADRLGVSYQTVSKWETGITSPDLSLIVPLARLFGVTTDELFGFSETADALRKQQLEEAFSETWKSGDLQKRLEVSRQAVKEFPDDMEWHDRLAWAQAMGSFSYKEDARYAQEQEEAIRRFAFVIENASDEKIKTSSIQGIVQYLSFRGRKAEAEKYAQLYPENYSVSKDDIMLDCLEGEKRTVHYQKMLEKAMYHLLNLIGNESDTACDAQEQILHIMSPDGKYVYYHSFLQDICHKRAIFRMKESDYDGAAEMIKQAFHHADAFDRLVAGKVSEKSLPFFDKITWNMEELLRTGTTTDVEDMLEALKNPLFAPLMEREDIKKLAEDNC